MGLETFLLGFPIHFDWSWKTLFNKDWEDIAFSYLGGSDGVPQAALPGLDRVRLLGPSRRQGQKGKKTVEGSKARTSAR